jgi:hypothetical protein
MNDDKRFFAKVDKTDSCWNWTAYCVPDGYGQFRYNSKIISAHRYSYTRFVGDIKDGLVIDHLCSNRKCVNPEHLEQVTQQENVSRATSKKKYCNYGHELDGIRQNKNRTNRYCKTCHSKHRKNWKENNREKYDEYMKEYQKEYQRKRYQEKKRVSGD